MSPLTALTNLLYPPACLLCRALLSVPPVSGTSPSARSQTPLCDACEQACPRNARGDRLAADTPARSPWLYADGAARAIQQFKYHRRWRIGRWLASDMVEAARASLPLDQIDAVVPVPLHWVKRRLRGYDPVAHLAHEVARSLSRPYWPRALRRTRWTATQTRLQGRARQRNVQGAFAAHPAMVRGRRILLVDDVLTSGATAEACIDALRQAGAARVCVVTAARTP